VKYIEPSCRECWEKVGRGVMLTAIHHAQQDYCTNCNSETTKKMYFEKDLEVKQKKGGLKHDTGKQRYDLIPADALDKFVEVLTFGSEKYGDNNWRLVDSMDERYFAALMRHMWAWKRGETFDEESGLPHLAHAACCVMFMLDEEAGEYE